MNDHEYSEFRCRCGAVLALTLGQTLCIGAVLIVQPVKLRCVTCGVSRMWRPSKKNEGARKTAPLAHA